MENTKTIKANVTSLKADFSPRTKFIATLVTRTAVGLIGVGVTAGITIYLHNKDNASESE